MTDEEKFICDGMTWSYSRLSSFQQCPYAWYRKYIDCDKNGENNAMAQYGTLMHEILEYYAKGNISIFEITEEFEKRFDECVTCDFPYNKYKNLRESYYEKGVDYLNNIDFDFEKYNILGVEKKIETEIGGYNLVGYIDLLLEDKETGDIIIEDNKSASLKILKSGKVSKTDQWHFEQFKKQLYIYAKAVLEQYGHVEKLRWNLFKEQKILEIPFNKEEYESSINWVTDTINQIKNEDLWLPNTEGEFFCRNICEYRNSCEFAPHYTKAEDNYYEEI